jgi:hypothetical protein
MAERNYLRAEILAVLDGDVPAIVYPSPREASVDLYFGRVGAKFFMVPVDRIERTIITVRPMRKDEKTIFIREVSDENQPPL